MRDHAQQTRETPLARIGRARWVVCALLFAATTINYTDRQVFAVLSPTLQPIIGWSEQQYGYIIAAFQLAYGLGLLFTGRFVDRVGTRIGYACILGAWSLAAMSHALVTTVAGFALARFALGLGESGNFPAAIKTVAEWFPRRERSLATGLFNSGSNVGAILAPLVVPWLTLRYSWRAAFLFTGVLSILWIATWLSRYRTPLKDSHLQHAELQYILAGQDAATGQPRRMPWSALLRHRQTWAYALAKFLTDPIWWFYLYWLPKFLHHAYGLTLAGLGLPLITVYLMADAGSIGGGYLPAHLMRRGIPPHRARKTAMLLCACAVLPILAVGHARSEWTAVLLIGLAAAAHQGWSANLYTTASDMFPQSAVGAVTGIGSSAGALGGVLLALLAGAVLEKTGLYWPLFALAACAYLLALGTLQAIVPRLAPVTLDTAGRP